MVKRLLAMVAVLAAVVRPDALAWGGSSGFTNRTLRGNYILEAAGLIANRLGTSAEITVLGLVNLTASTARVSNNREPDFYLLAPELPNRPAMPTSQKDQRIRSIAMARQL